MDVFENRLSQPNEKLNIHRLTECSTLNPHNYWLSNGRSIKEKNLESEIETNHDTEWLNAAQTPIKEKNLESEIETLFAVAGVRC